MITRIVETRVQEVIKKFPVTGIIGPRQCGKTTLVKSIMKYIPGTALYPDLESITDMRKLPAYLTRTPFLTSVKSPALSL
ncbi:MAG: AAA family ATPase [Ignavibacteriae bacterium]|nr:AAA family ATPase [Ignavibacteriota bacterium]